MAEGDHQGVPMQGVLVRPLPASAGRSSLCPRYG